MGETSRLGWAWSRGSIRREEKSGSDEYQRPDKQIEPGVSVSRLAREHGVNANLVRKWMKKAREERPLPLVSAFVPVRIVADMPTASGGDFLPKAEPSAKLSHASKVSALLPNGVSLTVECDDENGLVAIIGALGHVQTGR
ncbi:transposase [Agrobacterium radiobacter]